ncbi:MAG: DUF3570 domain-containing protein [Sandaracinaceae bacterium]
MRRRPFVWVGALSLVGALLTPAPSARANEGALSLFVRADSDRTTVIAPRVSALAVVEDRTRISGSYSADVWTSASIDIRTAATVPITEQRDQVDLSVSHELDDVTLGASYYYSGENDYWSHAFTLRSVQDLNGNTTTLEEQVRFVYDIVGRSGDPNFNRPTQTYGAKIVLTQILSPQAIFQLAYEGSFREGYQASPYRFVGIGGDGMCGWNPDVGQVGTALQCVPEVHPDTRQRNAAVARVRYAFSDDSSAGVEYRFYVDTWGILSHTAAAQIAWIPSPDQVFTLRYRFYQQSAATFYERVYDTADNRAYVTRDRENSPLFSNRVAISYQGIASLTDDVRLKLAIAVGGTVFVYTDFIGLSEVYSLDVTGAVTLEL